MAELRRFGLSDLLLLLAVLVLAGGARAGYLLAFADGGRNAGPFRVQEETLLPPDPENPNSPRPTEQEVLVDNLTKGWQFRCRAPFAAKDEDTAHVSPGYPWLLAGLHRVLPAEQVASAVRWGQVGLGTLTAALYFLFARRVFRSLLVGFLAGLLTALNPFWIIATATLSDGVLAGFLLALALALGSRSGEVGGAFSSLLYGLALAGLALVRAACLPFSFLALVWFLFRSRTLPRGWLAALLAFLGFANGLAPWIVRNVQAFHEPLPIVDSAWLHLWIGNNPDATGGPATEAMWANAPRQELQAVPRQPERYARLAPQVWKEVRAEPEKTIFRRLRAALIFLTGESWLEEGTLVGETSSSEAGLPAWWPPAATGISLQAALLVMLLLGFLGWRWSYAWRWESMPAFLAVVWIPLPYILGHGEALSGPRLPLDGVLLCYVALVLGALSPWSRAHLLEGPEGGPPRPGEGTV
jgi:4-amino-4-deoxy-L-arabinose transferase-like glycosyltransferase